MAGRPPRAHVTRKPPCPCETFGHLFAGGAIDDVTRRLADDDQLYAEYFIPRTQRSRLPIVMVHGGNQTGTNFTGTPDGREGWAQYFLRRGFAVYVVDQVARGRAANWEQAQGPMSPQSLERTAERFVAPARARLWPQAERHRQWPGSGEPGDPDVRAVLRLAVSLARRLQLPAGINRDALIALLDRIGPAILLTHSQGRRLRLAGGRCTARSSSRRSSRSSRTDLRSTTPISRAAGLVRRHRAPRFRARAGAADLRAAARCRRERSFVQQASPTSRTWCAAGSSRSRRGNRCNRRHADPDPDRRGILSRSLRSLHRRLSDPGRRRQHDDPAGGHRHPRQRSHDDAGEEQRRDRRRSSTAG